MRNVTIKAANPITAIEEGLKPGHPDGIESGNPAFGTRIQIHVPSVSLNTYKIALNWDTYYNNGQVVSP